MRKNRNYYIRKTHRYLGIFIGLQFLGWTVSGFYFAWNDIDNVRGNHLKKEIHALPALENTVSPDSALATLKAANTVDSVHRMQLVAVLDKVYYQVAYFMGVHTEEDHDVHLHYALLDAHTGKLKPSLNKEEAVAVAKSHLIAPEEPSAIALLQEVGSHHEVRGRHMPIWAVTFDQPNCTVYVSADMGTLQSVRHNQWRVFDLLWMFHTMDYAGRDNFNNWLLKLFSVFGLFTIFSGFLLFVVSSKRFRLKTTKSRKN